MTALDRERTAHHHRAPALCGCLAVLCAALPASAEFPGPFATGTADRNQAIAKILSESSDDPGGRREAVARIVELGDGVVPDVCAALFERRLHDYRSSELVPLDRASEALLVDALRAWPTDVTTGQFLELAVDADLGHQMLVAQLLGQLGDAGTLGSYFDLMGMMGPTRLQLPLVQKTVDGALAELLRRDPNGFAELRKSLDDIDQAHLPRVANALGLMGSGQGMGILTALMGRTDELDLAALEALGRMDHRDPRALTGEPAEAVRVHLTSLDPRVRNQAAIAVGRLRDTQSVSDLLGLLDDTDARVKRSAHWSLCEITGLRLPPSRERWAQYLVGEMSWYEEQVDALTRAAQGPDTFVAVDALRQLSDHPLHRRRLSEGIAPVLSHADEAVAVAACAAMARLGDPVALDPLVSALRDTRDPVRAAAANALESMTGEARPDPQAWEAWAAGS